MKIETYRYPSGNKFVIDYYTIAKGPSYIVLRNTYPTEPERVPRKTYTRAIKTLKKEVRRINALHKRGLL